MDDQNTSSTPPPQPAAPQADTSAPMPTPTDTPAPTDVTTVAPPPEPAADTTQTPPADVTTPPLYTTPPPAETASSPSEDNYITNVGESLIDLLDDIQGDDSLIQVVAKEMSLEPEKIKSILTPLLDKIDKGQITMEELALLMAAPVVDDASDENK